MPHVELREAIGCRKKFDVEIERERLDQEIKTTVRKLKRDVQIPGFRRGKAPESLILRRFGPGIRQEALKEMIPRVLQEVFESEGIKPVNEPNISNLEVSDTGPITFTLAVEELPEIDVAGFEDLSVVKFVREVTDDDVDSELYRIRRLQTRQEEVIRGAREGDTLIVNLQKLDRTGVPIIGEKMENYVIYLDGKSTPSPEFDEQVMGMKKGDRKTIRFTYDESINNPRLEGVTEAYDVEVLKVLENKVPELDNEFIASLNDFTDLDDLKAKTRERLARQFESYADRKLHEDLVAEFIKQVPFEVPNSMVEKIIQSEINRIRESHPDESFDENEYRTQLRPDAVRAVQTFLIIDKIKEEQHIEVTKEELDERIEVLAAINGMPQREFKRKLIKEGGLDDVKNTISQNKAYDWMVEVAEVNVEIVKEEPQESRIIKP